MRDKLTKLRKEKRKTQVEVAKHLGISRSSLSKKESGTRNFTEEEIESYAKYLGVEISLIIKL